MSILDLYAKSADDAIAADLARPAAPLDPSFSLNAAASAGVKGAVAGALEALGTGADALGSLDRLLPSAIVDQQARERQKANMERWGRASRAKADEFLPDPESAHWSTQVLGNFGRVGAKAAASVLTLGPYAGAAALGAEEGNTVGQRLMDKGVDAGTAATAGVVAGVTTAFGAALPASGSTLLKTLGLIGVGGPGSYAAGEAITRKVLQAAGYDKEAALHDPLDPMGLALSVAAPGIFAGVHSLGKLRTQKQVADAVQLSAAEQARSDAFERSDANLRELKAAVDAEKDPQKKAILAAELDKQGKAAAEAVHADVAEQAAKEPAAVDAARVKVAADSLARELPDAPEAYGEFARAADAVAAGERPQVLDFIPPAEREANFKAWFGDSKVVDAEGKPLVVYHGTAKSFDEFADPFESPRGQNFGRPDHWNYFTTDRWEADNFATHAADRSMYLFSEADSARANVMPVYVAMSNPLEVRPPAEWVRDQGESGMSYMDMHRQEIRQKYIDGGHDGVIAYNADGSIGVVATEYPNSVKSAIGNSGRFDPNSASLTDPLPRAEPARYVAPDRPPQIDTEPTQATQPKAAASEASPHADIAQALLRDQPDMPVILPGSDRPVTLAEAMDRIEAERKEQASFGELVRVAAQCALSGGATAAAGTA